MSYSPQSPADPNVIMMKTAGAKEQLVTKGRQNSQAMFQFSILLSRKFSLIEHFRGLRVFRGSTPTARPAGRSTSQGSWSDQCVREAGASNAVRYTAEPCNEKNLELPARFCSPALLLSSLISPLSRSGGGLPFSKISTTRFTSSRFLSIPGFKSLSIDPPPQWKTAMKVMMRQTMPAIPDTFGRTRSGSSRCQCLMRF